MSLFELNKVSRFYLINKKKKYVLKDVTISFPNKGLITILGKSGSGKSTLLNLLGKIDSPSEGTIYFNGDNLNRFNEKQISSYHSKSISFIFQHYHLLDNQSALYNVMLPKLIAGDTYENAKESAIKLLSDFSIKEELFDKRCIDLSGGERERIAILRSFVNNPQVILADEPTGALDKDNAILVMESLKRISKESLVILVTHNKTLAEKYSDRIIHLKDGKVDKDTRINQIDNSERNIPVKPARSNINWTNKIIVSNFLKRFKRNLFSIFSLVVGILSCMLIFGFANGKDNAIYKSVEKQLDYGSAYINKENKIVSNDSPITLIQSIRPNKEEITKLSNNLDEFYIDYSYDALITTYPDIYFNDLLIEDISFNPIHSFVDKSINKELLALGKFPRFDSLTQVVINKKAYELLNKQYGQDCLDSFIRVKEERAYSFYIDDVEKPYITDYFVFNKAIQIVGVVDEIEFLNTPKIYYSYVALDSYLSQSYLNNLSSIYGQISWKERVAMAQDNEDISSYTCRLFLKDISNINLLKQYRNSLTNYVISSNAITIEETLFSLLEAAGLGMDVFLAIALVGVSLIIGVISFASYSEDIKDCAILLCLGAKHDDIAFIYIFETITLGLISLVLSFLLSLAICFPLNLLIYKFTSLENLIVIPYLRYCGKRFLFPILVVVSTFVICVLATYIPISFSKRISLKEELKAND